MYDVLLSIRDPSTLDLLRAAFAERGVFRPAAAPRERLALLLAPPSNVAAVALDLNPASGDDREFLAALRRVNSGVQFLGVGPAVERSHFGPSRLELDVRTFVRTPVDPFDLARRLKRLADALVAD
jgi:hypothetical protein